MPTKQKKRVRIFCMNKKSEKIIETKYKNYNHERNLISDTGKMTPNTKCTYIKGYP